MKERFTKSWKWKTEHWSINHWAGDESKKTSIYRYRLYKNICCIWVNVGVFDALAEIEEYIERMSKVGYYD